MVEEDARAGEQAVGLAVVDRLPVAVELGAGVRAAGVEGGRQRLRRRGRAEHLGAGGLVEPHRLAAVELPDGLQQAQGAQADDVGGVERLVERDADVALGPEVVDLVGPDLLHQHRQARGVGQVGVVQVEAVAVLGVRPRCGRSASGSACWSGGPGRGRRSPACPAETRPGTSRPAR